METGQTQGLPEDLRVNLAKIGAELPKILKENLVGTYVYGSISYDDFIENSSDVDLMVLTKEPLTPQQLVELETWYQDNEFRTSRWTNRLEMDYAPIGSVSPDPINNFETTRFAGGKLIPKAKYEGACLDWENIREKGIALFGPPPIDVIPPISKEGLIEALKEKFLHLKTSAREWEKVDLWNQAFVIVQLCRVAYMQRCDQPVSKRQAARWCSENLCLARVVMGENAK